MFRVGIVKQQDLTKGKLRVTFPDYQQLGSYWLPLVVARAQNDKFYAMPDVGEQVVCLMDEFDEAGCVLGAIFSQADTAPSQMALSVGKKSGAQFRDGATIEYDPTTSTLTVEPPSAGAVNLVVGSGKVVLANGFAQMDGGPSVVQLTPSAITIQAGTAVITISTASNQITVNAIGGVLLESGGQYVSINPNQDGKIHSSSAIVQP